MGTLFHQEPRGDKIIGYVGTVKEILERMIHRRIIRKMPAHADYSDEVTDEQHERIKSLVKEEEFEDAEVVSGPAW